MDEAAKTLIDSIAGAAQGISEKLDHDADKLNKGLDAVCVNLRKAADRIESSVNVASEASERYAKSLARATWALVIATGILAVISAGLLYVAFNPPVRSVLGSLTAAT